MKPVVPWAVLCNLLYPCSGGIDVTRHFIRPATGITGIAWWYSPLVGAYGQVLCDLGNIKAIIETINLELYQLGSIPLGMEERISGQIDPFYWALGELEKKATDVYHLSLVML
jgi:hypothetical protein